MKWQGRTKQAGFSLVELAVATAIYSIGLGGLSLLLMASISGTGAAGDRFLGEIYLASMVELIAMNPETIRHYPMGPSASAPSCFEVECDAAGLAAANQDSWTRQVATDLPSGLGVICLDESPRDGTAEAPACDGGSDLVIKVFWNSPGRDEVAGAGRFVTRLPRQ